MTLVERASAALAIPAVVRVPEHGLGACAFERADDFAARTADLYQQQTGHTPAIYVCQATDGACLVDGE